MADLTLFVGLDVHKKTISVAMVEAAAGAEVRFFGTIAHTPDTLRALCRKLSRDRQQLHFCYEAGPCGYGVHRLLTGLGHRCEVVAPALIPRKVGDRVKTDRRDAMMLAQTLRAGQLTAVWVPDEAHEAMRDLVRLRTQAMRDLRKSRQQLLSFLLRHSRNSPYRHWTKMHRRWLGELVFAHPAQHLALEEMLQRIERAEALCDRLKAAILELVPQWSLAPVVQAIQALRGGDRRRGRLLRPVREPAHADGLSRAEPVGAFQRRHDPARRDHQDRQHAGADLPGRGGLDLSLPGSRHPDHPRPACGFARADPQHRLEGAGATVGALPQACRRRQADAQGCGGDRARARRLHLGDRSHG
jgi:transposase